MVENRPVLTGIEAVFIDLDDTLWDFTASSAVALRHVYDTYCIERWSGAYDVFRDLYKAKNKELWDLYHYGKIEKTFLVEERFRFPLLKIGYDGSDIDRFAADINTEYLRYLALQPNIVDGAIELLEFIRSRYGRVGVLSNGFKGTQQQKLISGGLDKYVDLLVLSDEVGVTKPLPGIFEYATNTWNVEPGKTLMIGDNYDADVCGAHNAGWRTIYFNRKSTDFATPAADATVDRLIDSVGLLK